MELLSDAYSISPAWFLAGVFVFTLMIGSFLNVVIYRLPIVLYRGWKNDCEEYLASPQAKEVTTETPFNLAVPRSKCPKCKSPISAIENIPVISYLALKGRCKNCDTNISPRYPLVELFTAVVSVYTVWHFGASIQAYVGLIFIWCLICLTMVDIDEKLLPDNITLPMLWGGLLVNAFGIFTSLEEAVYGAIAGYMSLWCVYWLFKLATRKEGMGFGDFKLLAAIGAWLGWQALPLVVILSSLVGAVLGIAILLIQGKDKSTPLPFGPYLAIAGAIALFWGDGIMDTYLSSFAR